MATPAAFEHSFVARSLVVDPDEATRHANALALRSLSLEVEEAEDGAEAYGRVLMRPPSLVLTETRMPRMDGFTLCQLLREHPPTASASILFIAGATESERVLRAGGDALVAKPCAPESLV